MDLQMLIWFVFIIMFVLNFVKLMEKVENHEKNRGLNKMILYDMFYYSEGIEE